jgi:hypothetical protein
MRDLKRYGAFLIGLVIAAVNVSPASAVTSLGATFDASAGGDCNSDQTLVQTGPSGYVAQFPGVITSWSYRAGATSPQLRLKVVRSLGSSDYLIVGESSLRTAPARTLSTFPARIPVAAGDAIGLYLATGGECYRNTADTSFLWTVIHDDPAVGSTADFNDQPDHIQLDIAAKLEADGDGDGFGDETQDTCLQDPSEQDCVAPKTKITKRPKAKTSKRRATFKFKSSERSSSFRCAIDGKEFSCVSPVIKKVGMGKHSFQVVAKDAAGNSDLSAAQAKWKVVRKHKKHSG